ncbi:hypothetical protein [Oceanirhabdus seepicola]|uniref:DUF5673 domain-containing protein n=1 Tax=Oceanirhabdus seepicola TaxID=2828781 RepID=A0A9J6NXC0_9CLOT|nr:hypothetical protein [Oceanirhabdus seepicola]MCM1988907.1 hypothetical protein [Oceanirhabdus seepicola]
MSKSKIRALIFILIVTLAGLAGGIFIAVKGVFFKEFMGLSMGNWFKVIIGIAITIVVLYDFISIRVKRKKYGELKYRLKRKDKRKQIIGLILLIIIFFIQILIFTRGFKKFDFDVVFLMYCVWPLPLMFLYRNIEKEGIGEGGVHYWGEIIKWDKVLRYSFRGDTLTVVSRSKSFGVNEIIEIPFIIEDGDKIDIEEFLSEKVGE